MLEVSGITQVFSGVTALDNVSFSVSKNAVTGIIGPNGAGKTTLFNIITGIYSQTSGKVFMEKRDISGFPPEKLAKLGLVRTFQNIELFGSMTAIENVMLGMHVRSAGGIAACSLKMPWISREERRVSEEALYWLDFTGISDIGSVTAGNLPFGKGRVLEIARAIASRPRIILMDEPAAGLNSQETILLAGLILKIRDLGITVILVEHDMELVMDICDRIIVLNLGTKLAEGSPRDIQENPEVITAYLGDDRE